MTVTEHEPVTATGNPGPGTVRVLGTGLLATAIADALPVAQGEESAVLVAASDCWDTSGHERLDRLCGAGAVTFLPVHTELGRVVLGPARRPGAPGCVRCLALRRELADPDAAARRAVLAEHAEPLAARPSSWLTPLAAHTVAALVTAEIERVARPALELAGPRFTTVELDTLEVAVHPFLPDPLCPCCAGERPDTAEAARLTLRAQPKQVPTGYRVRSVSGELAELKTRYVDQECGLIRRVDTGTEGGLVIAAAPIGWRATDRAEAGYGRTRSYHSAELIAVLEALERYAGGYPGRRRTTVCAPYADLGARAIDPRILGLYPPERYAIPGFGFQPFDPHREQRWVWGHSFARGEPVLVPESFAYYNTHHQHPDDPRLAYEVSNGCALGGCLEEAILYGLLEVAERDAFLMTWYARLPAPRIDLATARDPAIPLLLEAIEWESGYRVLAFDISVEQAVPAVWVMAVDPASAADSAGTADATDHGPAVQCAAAAHLDPEQALVAALSELGPMLTSLQRRYRQERDRARRLAGHPEEVVAMADHALLYADPVAARRLDFLTGTSAVVEVAEVGRPGVARADLTEDLTGLLERYLAADLDVIVVNQTTPELADGGFASVKVLVPGTLPMTFGHANRRVTGIPRLAEVPRLLGHRDGPLPAEEINPHPHPFP